MHACIIRVHISYILVLRSEGLHTPSCAGRGVAAGADQCDIQARAAREKTRARQSMYAAAAGGFVLHIARAQACSVVGRGGGGRGRVKPASVLRHRVHPRDWIMLPWHIAILSVVAVPRCQRFSSRPPPPEPATAAWTPCLPCTAPRPRAACRPRGPGLGAHRPRPGRPQLVEIAA